MMPEVSADEIEAGVRLPVGTTRAQAATMANEITSSTIEMFERNDLYRVAEGVKTNVRGQSFIDVEIAMKPSAERDLSARDVIQLWRDEPGDIEGVDQITFEAERGPDGWRDDISVDLSHANIDVLARASETFSQRLEQFEPTRDANDNYEAGKPQLDFELLPEGRSLGLTASDVGRQICDAFFGAIAMRQLRGTNEVEIRVKLREAERETIQALEDFVIRTPADGEVPLTDLARMREGEAFTAIDRRDGRRVITVSTDVEPKSAATRVLRELKQEVLPQLRADSPGITRSFQPGLFRIRP